MSPLCSIICKKILSFLFLFWRSLLLIIGSIFSPNVTLFFAIPIPASLQKSIAFFIPALCFPASLPFFPSAWSALSAFLYLLKSGFFHPSDPRPEADCSSSPMSSSVSFFFPPLLSWALYPCHPCHPSLGTLFKISITAEGSLRSTHLYTHHHLPHPSLEFNLAPCSARICLFGDAQMWLAFLPVYLFLILPRSKRLLKYLGP